MYIHYKYGYLLVCAMCFLRCTVWFHLHIYCEVINPLFQNQNFIIFLIIILFWGPHPHDLISTQLLKGPVSKYQHIRCQGFNTWIWGGDTNIRSIEMWDVLMYFSSNSYFICQQVRENFKSGVSSNSSIW